MSKGSIKVWLFLGLLSLALIVCGQMAAGRYGLLIGFLSALSINSLVFFYGDIRLKRLFPYEVLEGQDPWGLVSKVEKLSVRAALPRTPQVNLLNMSTPTTFSIGVHQKSAQIFISKALVEEFEDSEIEAVLAYEIARIHRLDTLSTTLASILASGFHMLAFAIDSLTLQWLRPRRPCQWRPGEVLLAPFISFLIFCCVGRRSQYMTDGLAAELLDSPQKMAEVLWKLNTYNATRPVNVSQTEAHIFIVSPLVACGWHRFFNCQPPVERRIKRLIGHFPL